MATVGEQWLIRCRKIHMTWGTLVTTTTCRLLLYTTLTGTPLRRTGPLLSLLRNIIFPAYATQTYIYNGFSHGEAFQSIFSLALQELHMRFLSLIQKKINPVHLIMVPHFKLFYICSVTGLSQSSANICHALGLPQAHPYDAMHLANMLSQEVTDCRCKLTRQLFP